MHIFTYISSIKNSKKHACRLYTKKKILASPEYAFFSVFRYSIKKISREVYLLIVFIITVSAALGTGHYLYFILLP